MVMGRICLFTRTSTLGQKLESQEDSLKSAAIADGYKEADFIVIGKKESAIKLSEEEREGLNELKKLIETEEIDCVYIAELSRLSRRPQILYSIREFLLQHKVQLKCLHPQFTLLTEDRSKYDATANVVFSLFGALAEQEMLEKKERFARGKKRKAEERKYCGGRIPYGYRIDKDSDNLIVVDEEQREIVKLIYDLYEKGMSQPKIAKELNDTGKANIKISLINHILINESYTGKKRKTKNASYERAYYPIITQEQFDHCRQIAKENNTNLSKAKNVYYAEHLVRCASCGAYWSATGSKASYHCAAAYKSASLWNYEYHRKERCTNKLSISINVLDSILWHIAVEKEACYREQDTEEAIQSTIKDIERINSILNNIEPRLNDNHSKMERLQEMYIDGLSKETYSRKKQELLEELNVIKSEEIKYKDELNHLNDNLTELQERKISRPLSVSDVMDIINGKIDSILSSYPLMHAEIKSRIAREKNDTERSKIIHRQIKSVEIVHRMIKYPFKSGEKDVKSKLVIVHTYLPSRSEKENNKTEGIIKYYAIPNGGYGPLIIELYPDMIDNDTSYLYDYELKDYLPFEEISDYIYLNRFHDVPKRNRRTKKSIEREKMIGDKLSISDIRKKYNLSYTSVYNQIHFGKIQSVMIGGVFYVDKDVAEKTFGKVENKSIDDTTPTTLGD